MDKYEYKVRSEEIRALIARGEYAEAAEVADMIDWRRVKSVMMLCTISDLYKINRRLDDSKELLLLAYERHPGGRTIVYSLCELSIKMGEFVQAIEYYKEYVQIAPKDSGRYILQYKLYVAQEVSLEERIEVLEEMKKRDYREKWAYELAYLYHRVGLATRCVEECDELIVWFGEGKYVTKAMELKMLHCPLTPEQQAKYEGRFGEYQEAGEPTAMDEDNPIDVTGAPTVEITGGELDDIQVKTMDVGQYNTINLQKELADSMKELWENAPASRQPQVMTEEFFSTADMDTIGSEIEEEEKEETEEITRAIVAPLFENTEEITEIEIPEEIENEKEAELEAEPIEETPEEEEVFGEVWIQGEEKDAEEKEQPEVKPAPRPVLIRPSGFDKMLGMEYDGQISLIVPDSEKVEKQITGQINIEDILSEWEKMKKDNEQKRAEEVRQLVLQHTGNILVDFDQMAKDGLLEQLEEVPENTEKAEAWEELSGEAEPVSEESEEPEESDKPDEPEEIIEEQEELKAPEEPEEPMEEMQEPIEESMEALRQEDTEKGEETAESPIEETNEDGQKEPDPDGQSIRALTREERELYAAFIQNRKAKEQLVSAIDALSLAAYTGNLIITGEEGMDTLTLAKNMMKEVQMTDHNFSGKIAKITGQSLNKRDVAKILSRLQNGALIIEGAGKLEQETAGRLEKALQQENYGVIVVLEDTKKSISRLLATVPTLAEFFNARVDIEALDNDSLVAFGVKYAKEREYSIDEMGLLALHTCISDNQTSDHSVTIIEVKEMIDEAIAHANKKTMGHFFDILIAKRYDEEDMIILKEKDFRL